MLHHQTVEERRRCRKQNRSSECCDLDTASIRFLVQRREVDRRKRQSPDTRRRRWFTTFAHHQQRIEGRCRQIPRQHRRWCWRSAFDELRRVGTELCSRNCGRQPQYGGYVERRHRERCLV